MGAHARALMHYETHVRAKHGGGLNIAALACTTYEDHEVAFLQAGSTFRLVICCVFKSPAAVFSTPWKWGGTVTYEEVLRRVGGAGPS